MALVIVGDLHGKVSEFRNLITRRTQPEDTIIQVGDVGFGFDTIPDFPDNVKLIRGNHDGPNEARAHKNYLGDWGYWEEHDLFYVGGAWSIDYAWRQAWNLKEKSDWLKWKSQSSKPPRKIWWEDEELSQEELDKATELYAKIKPKIMITHEAPASIVPHVLSKVTLDLSTSPLVNVEWEKYRDESSYNRPEKLECIKTRTSTALQGMLEIWRPKFWCMGHYHISKIVDTGSTLFKCCAELEPFTIPGT